MQGIHYKCTSCFQKLKKNEEPVHINQSLAINKSEAAIDDMFTKENITRGEFRWALKQVNQNFGLIHTRLPTHFFCEIVPDNFSGTKYNLPRKSSENVLFSMSAGKI